MTLFNTKKTLTLISAVALSMGLTQAANADQSNGSYMSNPNMQLVQMGTKSPTGGGQWRTLSSGCSYSRAQAPGYAPTWHLIVNPTKMGLPARPRNCKPMLGN